MKNTDAKEADRRALDSLEGLSLGDAFGEQFFGAPETVVPRIERRQLREGPWRYTDDTEMALSIVDVLLAKGEVDQDLLALLFAEQMTPTRGYGVGAFQILTAIANGKHWRRASTAGFNGMGSFGNGAAMRVAPLGAYFATQPLEFIATQARLSAELTHAHPEGIAGAIAVAVAAALAHRYQDNKTALGRDFIREVRQSIPAGYTRDAIDEAIGLPDTTELAQAARVLGNGSGITAPDTVPFCLWVVARISNDFAEAMWTTVSALGDRDTTCAIVGGILGARLSRDAMPREWLARREALPNSASGDV